MEGHTVKITHYDNDEQPKPIPVPSIHPTMPSLIAVESSLMLDDDGEKWIRTTTYQNLETIRKIAVDEHKEQSMREASEAAELLSLLVHRGTMVVLAALAVVTLWIVIGAFK